MGRRCRKLPWLHVSGGSCAANGWALTLIHTLIVCVSLTSHRGRREEEGGRESWWNLLPLVPTTLVRPASDVQR